MGEQGSSGEEEEEEAMLVKRVEERRQGQRLVRKDGQRCDGTSLKWDEMRPVADDQTQKLTRKQNENEKMSRMSGDTGLNLNLSLSLSQGEEYEVR